MLERFTGLEQYYWEKAGYFVRHIPSTELPANSGEFHNLVYPVVIGVLGLEVMSLQTEILPFNMWNRSELPIDVDQFQLTARDASLNVLAPHSLISISLIPGSHVAPLEAETRSRIANGLFVDIAVNIELRAGDILFYNPYLANCVLVNMDMALGPLRFIGPGHPVYAHSIQ